MIDRQCITAASRKRLFHSELASNFFHFCIEKLYHENEEEKRGKKERESCGEGERTCAGCVEKQNFSTTGDLEQLPGEWEKFLLKTSSRSAWRCLRSIPVYYFDQSWSAYNRTSVNDESRFRDIPRVHKWQTFGNAWGGYRMLD